MIKYLYNNNTEYNLLWFVNDYLMSKTLMTRLSPSMNKRTGPFNFKRFTDCSFYYKWFNHLLKMTRSNPILRFAVSNPMKTLSKLITTTLNTSSIQKTNERIKLRQFVAFQLLFFKTHFSSLDCSLGNKSISKWGSYHETTFFSEHDDTFRHDHQSRVRRFKITRLIRCLLVNERYRNADKPRV